MKQTKILILFLILTAGVIQAKRPVILTLEKTISLATDSSLESFRSKNMYLSSYWQYRTYKADRLPSLTLNLTPAEYYRYITLRYDYENDLDVYRPVQTYTARGGLYLNQNLDLLGGSFYVETDIELTRTLGNDKYNQFSSVPFRIGYYQNLLGYNPFKWEKKIEPLKYDKAKKELIYNMESISESATNYFFTLAMAQVDHDMAKDNVASTDTLYRMGEERHKIASITQADLLTLKLYAVNARNKLQNAEIALKRAMFNLASYLNFDKNTEIRLELPDRPKSVDITLDKALMLARENNPNYISMQQSILEAEQQVDRTKKESMFNATVRASLGFNQVAYKFWDAYSDLRRQDIVSLSVSVPILDWGVRRGKYNMAKNNLIIAQIAARQSELSIEEDVIMTVSEFNIKQDLIYSAEEAMKLANMAYAQTKERFIIGKADLNSLTLSLQRQQDAQSNYITALQNYWLSYYKIRKLTLHDFDTGFSLSTMFDFINNF